ncbi:hypothetical protein DSCW_21090 [Desulfosarcina widdelii]|uniref:Bacteriophage CI repressor N-terminal domain-containing protein n=2 Tax=Desulfosarcina widdelii TaxID=947919 RepID=A0A5K7YYC0_9BACT|nr:hypothetical protein DSCW_21090 [Desulfosarcina widdelii]
MKSISGLSQKEMASEIFGISEKNLSNKIRRGTVDINILIKWAGNKSVDLNWLLTGEGETYLKDKALNKDDTNAEKPLHSIIIERFKQKDLARDINYEMLKLEELKPEALIEVNDFIRFKVQSLTGQYERRKGERRQRDEDYNGENRRGGEDRRKASGED